MAAEEAVIQRLRIQHPESADIPEKFSEVIEGELFVWAPAGNLHNKACLRILSLFERFCADKPELDYGGDNDGFLLRRNLVTLLSPDATLYRRRPAQDTTWLEFAPELVVEVLSPSNHPAEMAYKRQAFFEAGAEQFWLVDPEQRTLTVHFRDGRNIQAAVGEVVRGEGIAAGMEIRLAELFPSS